jgi:hypothetical protein
MYVQTDDETETGTITYEVPDSVMIFGSPKLEAEAELAAARESERTQQQQLDALLQQQQLDALQQQQQLDALQQQLGYGTSAAVAPRSCRRC